MLNLFLALLPFFTTLALSIHLASFFRLLFRVPKTFSVLKSGALRSPNTCSLSPPPTRCFPSLAPSLPPSFIIFSPFESFSLRSLFLSHSRLSIFLPLDRPALFSSASQSVPLSLTRTTTHTWEDIELGRKMDYWRKKFTMTAGLEMGNVIHTRRET